MNRGSDPVFLAALLLAAAACFAPGRHAPPSFDDGPYIWANPRLADLGTHLRSWIDPAARAAGGAEAPHCWRPLTEASFLANLRFAPSPEAMRAVNVALHMGASVLVFLLAGRALGPGPAARWAALFFSVHPLGVQAVTYLWQRAQCLSVFLMLLSLWLHASGRRKRSLAVGLLAMAAKETAVTLPLLVAAWEWALRDPAEPPGRPFRRIIPFAILPLPAAVQALRLAAPPSTHGPLGYLLLSCGVLAHYLRLAFLPFPMQFCYDKIPGPDLARCLPAAAALAAGLAWIALGPARHRLPRLALALFLAPLALECSVFPMEEAVWNYRAYPAMLGAGLLFGGAAARREALALAALACLAPLNALENRHWADPDRMMRREVRHAWHTPNIWANHVMQVEARGLPARVERLTRQALRLQGPRYRLTLQRARALDDLGRAPEAEALLRAALPEYGRQALVWDHLGHALLAQGRLAEAEEAYRRALAMDPEMPKARLNLGLLLYRRGDLDGAEATFREALRQDPGYALARRNLEVVLQRKKGGARP